MNIVLLLLIILLWGFWGFFVKISMQKIGLQTLLWSTISSVVIMLLYFIFNSQFHKINIAKLGILFGLLAGVVSSLGLILFCKLLTTEKLSLVIPVSSLYPAITVMLAIFILGDKLTITNFFGIFFAIVAGVFLGIR